MDDNQTYTQEQLKETWEASRAAEPPFRHLTFYTVVGGPGSGKGSQCIQLSQWFGITYLSEWAMLRDEGNRPGSPFTAAIQRAAWQGELCDIGLTFALLKQSLRAAEQIGERTFILNGFIRDVERLKYFQEHIGPIRMVMYLDHEDETLIRRIEKRGKEIDTEARTRTRLEEFRKSVTPMVKYLEENATRDQMYCRVIGWEEDDKLQIETRTAFADTLKRWRKRR